MHWRHLMRVLPAVGARLVEQMRELASEAEDTGKHVVREFLRAEVREIRNHHAAAASGGGIDQFVPCADARQDPAVRQRGQQSIVYAGAVQEQAMAARAVGGDGLRIMSLLQHYLDARRTRSRQILGQHVKFAGIGMHHQP